MPFDFIKRTETRTMKTDKTHNEHFKEFSERKTFENLVSRVKKVIHSSHRLAKLIGKYLNEKDEVKKRNISKNISLLLKK